MRASEELLAQLRSLDIQVWAEGEKLRYNAPQGVLTPELRAQLKEQKTEILAVLREKSLVSQPLLTPIPPTPRDEFIPLSFSQQRLWFFDQLEGHSAAYNISFVLRFQGTLRIALLEQCFTEIVRRHEALRTIFRTVNGTPGQVITPPQPVAFDIKNLPHISEIQRETEIPRLSREEAQKPFDLSKYPLFRFSLYRFDEYDHVLFLTLHHIIYDAWSARVLVHEFVALYHAFLQGKPSPLPELAIQYADFAVWQRQWLSEASLQKQLVYWKEQLTGVPTLLDLPTDKPRPPKQSLQGDVVLFDIDVTLTQQLRALSRQSDATLFMTLLTGFTVLLFRYSKQQDIVIGSPIANRNRQELEPLIGFFVNTLALRIDASGNPTFAELLQRVQRVALSAYSHQDVPFEQLVEVLHPERNLSHAPLCQVMFVLQNVPIEELKLPEVSLSPQVIDTGSTEFDLILEIRETHGKLQGKIIYNCDLFYQETIQRFVQHFQCLLQSVITNPRHHISDLSILTETEQQQILQEWNATQAEYPDNKCIHQLFEEQVEKTPDAVAVVFEDQQLSYRELNQRANQLAHYLRKFGVGPESLVGICVEKSIEMIVGILGVLKAGGAYLPLDSAYPQERLAFMISDAQIPILLTQEHLRFQLPKHRAQVITLDTDWPLIARELENQPQSFVLPDNLAYVIYTSGSTGKPKGTLLAHRGLCNVAQAQANSFHLTRNDNVLQFSSFSFDAATFEIVMALTTGSSICLGNRETLLPGPNLIKFLQEHHISIVTLPPSALANLPVEELPVLRKITVAGEACPPDLVARWAQGRSFFNLYGPTETTIWATVAQCTETTQKPPIGRPIDNTHVYVLDEHFEPVSVGVPGELYIGGVGLARGYLNRPELTAEKFVPNPFSQNIGARLYKTGDLVRYLPDGNLEFLGRIDHQVKLRGFRIELGEIEALLSTHPLVRETAVMIREVRPDRKRLVAYIVPENDQFSVVNDIRQFLSQKLPDYMVPAAYVLLKALPLTPNGKIDRRALPAPETILDRPEAYAAPRTPLEERLVHIWQEVLQVENIGIYDDFFESGGHSLLAAQLISKMQQQFNCTVPLSLLFDSPTIAQLAEAMAQPAGTAAFTLLIPLQTEGKSQPFFAVHPGNGQVFCYTEFVRQSGAAQRFYGLQASGLEPGTLPLNSIPDMARQYIQAIHTVQPQGPYWLGGFCIGGTIAYQMALQLQQQGEEVAMLILLDTLAPHLYEKMQATLVGDDVQHFMVFGQELGTFFGKDLTPIYAELRHIDLARDGLEALRQDLSSCSPRQRIELLFTCVQQAGILLPEESLDFLERMIAVHRANAHAIFGYTPAPYTVSPVLLFRAIDNQMNREFDSTLGWRNYVSEELLHVEEVPGDHFSMLRMPQVRVLAEKFVRTLNRVGSASKPRGGEPALSHERPLDLEAEACLPEIA